MLWIIWIASYFVGGLLALRVITLKARDKYERKLMELSRRYDDLRPDWDDYVWAIVPLVLFWPMTVLILGSWKLIFPRGVKTQFAREQELHAALLRTQREADAQELRIKSLEKQVLAWTPMPHDRQHQS